MPNVKLQPGLPAVGIDLGTTYSSLAHLTPQGEPVTLPNGEGELSTPSVVLFEGSDIVVGTEALRRSVAQPERVVAHAKRYMGDPKKKWVFDGRTYRPQDISAFVLKKLLSAAEERLGKIRHAVITVPARFSELQREATVEAGILAGLERVDIVNEPTAAAMCYVLGEGMWFDELARDQTILVFDLGGGTFDLSLVQYNRDTVRVLATGGDLKLGGLDWNKVLEEFACDEYVKESIGDPRLDRESMQALALEVEQVKRSLSVRPRSTLLVQHDGRRKTYSIDREHFELLTKPLLVRTEHLTKALLKQRNMGWAHVDAVLVTGGASRMPMIRDMLQRISGTTLNQTLSPDQSICHGATYFAGKLLSAQVSEPVNLQPAAREKLAAFQQKNVCGRSLGILVRNIETGQHVPHYLIQENTPLPCSTRQRYGTVVANQRRVHVRIVESGASEGEQWVELGDMVIDELTPDLPLDSPVDVTIRYDEQARVHIEALEVASGKKVRTTIVREGVSKPVESPAEPQPQRAPAASPPRPRPRSEEGPPKVRPAELRGAGGKKGVELTLEKAERPVPLCARCGEVLDSRGACPQCGGRSSPATKPSQTRRKPG